MHMSFWFGTDLGTFLFSNYNVSTLWPFIATCLGLISLALIYEAMKVFQMKLHKRTVSVLDSSISSSSENSSLLAQGTTVAPKTIQQWQKWLRWTLEILHWTLHTTLGYILMLAVMTFNGYIGIALIIGASIGYWLFGMTLIEMNLEQFNEARNKITSCDPECADAIGSEESRVSNVSSVQEQLITEVTAEVHSGTPS